MKQLVIKEIDNYDYLLEDKEKNQYELNMGFYGLDQKVSVGDIIYLPGNLLKNNGVYSFGLVQNTNNSINEYIKIIIDNKEYYLQRYYG